MTRSTILLHGVEYRRHPKPQPTDRSEKRRLTEVVRALQFAADNMALQESTAHFTAIRLLAEMEFALRTHDCIRTIPLTDLLDGHLPSEPPISLDDLQPGRGCFSARRKNSAKWQPG